MKTVRYDTIIKVSYNGKIYELLNDYDDAYRYNESTIIKAYLSEDKLYANEAGVKSDTGIATAYFVLLFITMGLFAVFITAWIYYKKEKNINKNNVTPKNIESLIEEKSKKIAKINIVERDKPKREFADFGILGEFELNDIQYKTNKKLTEEQKQIEKLKILNGYKENLEEINKKIFSNIIYHLECTDYNIWEYDSFDKIINKEKLPDNFNSLSNEQKRKILYFVDYEFGDKIQEIKTVWNINNLKDDITITNIVIDANYKHIDIEFNGVCDFFVAYISINYAEDYQIKQFDPS